MKPDFNFASNYINGKWIESSPSDNQEIINPATLEKIGIVKFSTKDEVDDAVKAAKKAFREWRLTPAVVRARYLFKLRDLLERDFEEISRILDKRKRQGHSRIARLGDDAVSRMSKPPAEYRPRCRESISKISPPASIAM